VRQSVIHEKDGKLQLLHSKSSSRKNDGDSTHKHIQEEEGEDDGDDHNSQSKDAGSLSKRSIFSKDTSTKKKHELSQELDPI
jgi:hypothetical protein